MTHVQQILSLAALGAVSEHMKSSEVLNAQFVINGMNEEKTRVLTRKEYCVFIGWEAEILHGTEYARQRVCERIPKPALECDFTELCKEMKHHGFKLLYIDKCIEPS